MGTVAEWMWNPFLTLLYLELGVLFIVLTGAMAYREGRKAFMNIWRSSSKTSNTSNTPGDSQNSLSHKKAFMASLAATVGVGNLAGVGTAIHLGGPGALFWMWVSAIMGMSFRMVSTYMAIKHRPDDVTAPSFGTPMAYLEKKLPGKWKIMGPIMAGLILLKGQVVANIIQANSVGQALQNELGIAPLYVGFTLASLVGLVIIGGMRRIVDVSSAIAPWMVTAYVLTGSAILLTNPLTTLSSLGSVFFYAFHPYSIAGGIIGFTITQALQFGVSRGVFSHASGIGVAPFLQGANKGHPSVGAYMAAFTPFVDTIIICSITGLVILSSGEWQQYTGAHLTARAFYNALGPTGYQIVSLCLIIFAFTTIIGWAFCSEKCFLYLGFKNIKIYRYLFVMVTFSGPFLSVAFVWSLADIIIGLLLLANLLPLTYILLRNLRETRIDLAAKSKMKKQAGAMSAIRSRL